MAFSSLEKKSGAFGDVKYQTFDATFAGVDNGVIKTGLSNVLFVKSNNPVSERNGICEGNYVTAAVAALKVIQDLTYTAVTAGAAGNSITVAYTGGATAGAEVVSVVGNAISIQIETGVSTATQVRSAFNATGAATALASCSVSGTGSNAQVVATAAALAGGSDAVINYGDIKLSSFTASDTAEIFVIGY